MLKQKDLMVISYSCSAGTKLAWILSLLLILVAATQVHGVSPPGNYQSCFLCEPASL
jgi:hypothetical protein